MLIFSYSFPNKLMLQTCDIKTTRKWLCPALNLLCRNASRNCICNSWTPRKMVSDSGPCLCVSCDAGVILLAQHSTMASLALPSQQNNKHASQANSSCHVVNGLGYTSWRPAEAFTLRGGITNTVSLSVGWMWHEHYSGGGGEEGTFLLAQVICQRMWEWMEVLPTEWLNTQGCPNTFLNKWKQVCPPRADRGAKVCQWWEEVSWVWKQPLVAGDILGSLFMFVWVTFEGCSLLQQS